MPPKRYLIATLFIAAMLVLLAIVQAPKSKSQGGVATGNVVPSLSLDSFQTLAEYRLQNGWAPRFLENKDPDQLEPWPPAGGFEPPWEPASPYLGDSGFIMNGPNGRSEVVLWRGLEWKRLPFDTPIVSARLDPLKGTYLLLTLKRGSGLYTTRLLALPEGRVIWSTNSGPWSRFSWDGKGVMVGLPCPTLSGAWLLTALPVDREWPPRTLADWTEPRFPKAQKHWMTKEEQLWDDGKDLPGPRTLVHLPPGARFWYVRHDKLWITAKGEWCLWGLEKAKWIRLACDDGTLCAHPPLAMGKMGISHDGKGGAVERSLSPLDRAVWKVVEASQPEWPAYDAAWTWKEETSAITAWDLRYGPGWQGFPKDNQRQAIKNNFRSEWLEATNLRRAVKGWLPDGPDVGLREAEGVAWVWVGDRVLLVKLTAEERLRKIGSLIKAK